jgi:hypothetical protein
MGWAQEMRAWYALTQGNLPGVVAAAEAGEATAPHHGVAVQLAAQRAKAWARIGDRRQVELALDQGRKLLESLPYPENLDHHFVVDPSKFDFYAMDCYRTLGKDSRAEIYAREVIRSATDPRHDPAPELPGRARSSALPRRPARHRRLTLAHPCLSRSGETWGRPRHTSTRAGRSG